VKFFANSVGIVLASLLGFQSSLAFCVCHSGETHSTKIALPHAAGTEEEHPCHGQAEGNTAAHSSGGIAQEHRAGTDSHDQNHGCCCIRKDNAAVKSETCANCFSKEKYSSVAFHSASVSDLSDTTPFLSKYCHSHAPPQETPLYLRLKTLRI